MAGKIPSESWHVQALFNRWRESEREREREREREGEGERERERERESLLTINK